MANDKIDTNTGNNESGKHDFASPITKRIDDPAQQLVDDMKHLSVMMSLVTIGEEMRHAQKQFFKLRKSGTQKEITEWLATSKRLEKEFDDLIAKFRARNSAQTNLF